MITSSEIIVNINAMRLIYIAQDHNQSHEVVMGK